MELRSLRFESALRYAPDFSQTGYSLRSLYIANLEGKNKTINLNPLVKLIEFELSRSGLHEIPRSISLISKTIRILDLSYNDITTLENMENIVFPNLSRLNLMENCIYHLNHISLKLPNLSYITLYQNSLTHLDDMSTCQWGMANRESWISITLHGNPWHCNGSMLWLQSSLCTQCIQPHITFGNPRHLPLIYPDWCATVQRNFMENIWLHWTSLSLTT